MAFLKPKSSFSTKSRSAPRPWLKLFIFHLGLYLVGLFLGACATIRHFPPDPQHKEDPVAQAWSSTYQLALEYSKNGNTTEACKLWGELKSDKDFSLSDLAFIYHLYCIQDANQLDKILNNYSPPKYLRKPFYEILGRSPTVEQLRPQLKISSLENLANMTVVKAEKIKLLQMALETAKKGNIDTTITRLEKKLEGLSISTTIRPGRISSEIGEDQYLDIAKQFIKDREFATARRYLERIIFKNQEDLNYLVEAWQIYAKTFKSEQDRDKYKLKLDALWRYLVNFAKKEEEKALKSSIELKTIGQHPVLAFLEEIGIELARALWTDEGEKKAIAVLEKLKTIQEKFTGKHSSEIKILLAKIFLSKGDEEKANELFQLSLSGKDIGDNTRADIYHLLGFNEILKGRDSEALAFFEKASKLNLKGMDKNKFRYWNAKIKKNIKTSLGLVQAADFEDVQEDFRKIAEDDEMGYYGTLSSFELVNELKPLQRLNYSEIVLDEKFEWLVHFRLNDLAYQYLLDNTQGKNAPFKNKTAEEQLLFLSKANIHHEVFYRLNKMDDKSYDVFLKKYPTILIPTPFLELFKKGAAESGLEIEIPLAISKQESGFNEFAKSPADAFGLMQLIIPSAELAAKQAKIKLTGPEDLFVPDINLILGPTLFRKYLNDFEGRFPETIMSYNAGPEAAKRWSRKYFLPFCNDPNTCSGDKRLMATLLLIEMVGYKETNGYVKKVLRNYFNYKRLLAGRPVSVDELKTIFY